MRRFLFLLIVLANHCLLSATAQDIIFREYDIRGVVGKEFNIEDSYEIACAIAAYFLEKDATIRTIALGADGRVHSPAIKQQICKALLERGFNIIDIGTCTTPIMYFTMYTAPIDAGLMITASHNPGEYNGIKLCRGKFSVFGQEIKKIRDLYTNKQFPAITEQAGSYQKVNMIARYIDYLVQLFPHLVGADLHVIIDCGNGAAGTVLPLLLKQMQWHHVQLLYPEVDGTYPNHIADPTVEKYMQDLKAEILKSHVHLGVGLDGDCDRMAPMTKSGQLVKGDQLLTIYSQKILEQYPGSSVVFDISSSRALLDVIRKWGGIPVLSATGCVHVKQKMNETGALIGGEISCHTCFKERYFGFDDGIYSMMRLFELLQMTGRSLDEWLTELPQPFSSPLYRLACERTLCFKIINAIQENLSQRPDIELFSIDGLRIHFPYGWAIVRASNTEPVISMRFEGNTPEDLHRLKQEFYEMISPYFDCSTILDIM